MIKKFLAVSCTAWVLASTGAVNAETVLNVSTYLPSSHPLVSTGLTKWAKQVEEATKGEVKLRILPTSLGKPEAHFDMARDGIADITMGIPGYTPGRFKLIEVAALPNMANTGTGLSVGLWRTFDASPAMQEEFEGVKPLTVFTTSPMHFFSTGGEINSVEDFQGLKARSAGGNMTEVERQLGMTPLLQPVGKSYELLSGGVADAVINPLETVKSLKFDKLIKNALVVPGGLTAATIFVVMNEQSFEELSPENQRALLDASGENLARIMGQIWDTRDNDGLKSLETENANVKTADAALREQIFAATQPVVDNWIKTAKEERNTDGVALLKSMRANIAAVEKQ
tara:strand:- start:38307 stop:39332 length:1026 start_codon:yes stop_codon:yes gene_type:complete